MHQSYKKWLDDGKPKVYCSCECGNEVKEEILNIIEV